jgi:uncharacterized protein
MSDLPYDPNKDRINRQKHGIGLDAAARFDWETAVELGGQWEEDEYREVALGFIGDPLYFLVYTWRADADGNAHRRFISLRKANKREKVRYVRETGFG